MPLPTKDELRARFWELNAAKEAVEAKVEALRAKYEPQWNAAMEKRKAQSAEIKAVEADVGVDGLSLFDAKQELAFLARGLGNVGDDPRKAKADAE